MFRTLCHKADVFSRHSWPTEEQDIPGDLSALSLEEMQRIALQVLVKLLG